MYILKTTNELIFLLHVHIENNKCELHIDFPTTCTYWIDFPTTIENNKWINFPTTCTYWKQQVNWFSYYMYILKTTSELICLLHVHIENNKWINFPTTCTYWKQQMN